MPATSRRPGAGSGALAACCTDPRRSTPIQGPHPAPGAAPAPPRPRGRPPPRPAPPVFVRTSGPPDSSGSAIAPARRRPPAACCRLSATCKARPPGRRVGGPSPDRGCCFVTASSCKRHGDSTAVKAQLDRGSLQGSVSKTRSSGLAVRAGHEGRAGLLVRAALVRWGWLRTSRTVHYSVHS